MAILVGDADGVLYTYEKGNFSVDEPIRVGSATKIATGLAIWRLVEDGALSLTDNPQSQIGFWTNVEPGGRSGVTLEQLMAFTSGFTNPPQDAGCIGDGSLALADCVRQIHDDGVDHMPGAEFYYGPEHMQVAALMASEATGMSYPDFMRDVLFDPAGVSAATRFPIGSGENPRASGGMISTASDMALILSDVLAGDIVSDTDGFLEDRTSNVFFGFRPDAIGSNGLDWHYGFGFWKECDLASYQPECDVTPTISSPGAFGFTPWIDFEHEYWGIVAFEETRSSTFTPAEASVELEQALQPLIEDALSR